MVEVLTHRQHEIFHGVVLRTHVTFSTATIDFRSLSSSYDTALNEIKPLFAVIDEIVNATNTQLLQENPF